MATTAAPAATWTEVCRAALVAAARSVDAGESLPIAEEPADALGMFRQKFALNEIEFGIVSLLAGIEACPDVVEPLTATMPGSQPTIQWCLDHFGIGSNGDSAWSALLPDSTLRRAQIVRPGPATTFAGSPLRLDEHVLHFLLGYPGLATAISNIALPVDDLTAADDPAHGAAVRQIGACFSRREFFVSLDECSPASALDIAAAAAAAHGWGIVSIDARAVPQDRRQLADLAGLWNRESVLHDLVLVVDLSHLGPMEPMSCVVQFLHDVHSPVIAFGRLPAPMHRAYSTVSVAPATARHHRDVADSPTPEHRRAGSALAERAQKISQEVRLDDVVLPPESRAQLDGVVTRVRHAQTVYADWGFDAGRGASGVSALFAGPSGTGKTMAALAIATELGLDLYRIDLAATVSKYIGETEQNLARIFDAAERCRAVLLFDEADALFGKRSEVRDSHDRYANIEVSYLLQRIEQYTGVAILTSNIKSALDHAFARRLAVVVDFPLPGAVERAEIWRRALPADAPTEGLDPEQLARLSIAGGSIRNIALAAAFSAADEGAPIGYRHILGAARGEYAKLGRQLGAAETRGWSS